jgi:aromatic-L-amino-acid decarboxylase
MSVRRLDPCTELAAAPDLGHEVHWRASGFRQVRRRGLRRCDASCVGGPIIAAMPSDPVHSRQGHPSRIGRSPQIAGDMPAEEFRQAGHHLVDWITEYLEGTGHYPVLSQVHPGEIAGGFPSAADPSGASFDTIWSEFERVIVPGLTHWNRPTFFAYFSISASGPGILADFLSSALNQQAMLWRTSPSATELERVALGWLRQLIGLTPEFEGVIYDTASISTLHALASARERCVPAVRTLGLAGRPALPAYRIYCSEHAHSSVDKAVILLGFGHSALVKIPADSHFRMRPDLLESAIASDRAAGRQPLAVVATVGTTSTTSVDPVSSIADICRREEIWLHVDAAYAGVAAMVPGLEWVLEGADRADSLVVNPHKWLFTPFDLSAFYTRHLDTLKAAFSLVPEYLKTSEAGTVENLMDTGVQLGRRFRALKLWMILRYFGAEGLRARIGEHIRLAQVFAGWVKDSPRFELMAPAPFSVVCFRARPAALGSDEAALDAFNERLMEAVNRAGDVFLSHTRLGGRFVIRLAIGHIRTTEQHVRQAWDVLCDWVTRLELGHTHE